MRRQMLQGGETATGSMWQQEHLDFQLLGWQGLVHVSLLFAAVVTRALESELLSHLEEAWGRSGACGMSCSNTLYCSLSKHTHFLSPNTDGGSHYMHMRVHV